ncbi:hypothetical protein BH20ACT6_BH20ACT6_06660 [soil metagenome]
MSGRSKPPAPDDAAQKRQRRSRSRHAGSIADYPTKQGQRWKFQIYVPRDPEKPELGDFRITRGGFKNLDGAQAALAEALKKKAQNERFQGKVPTIGDYADQWVAGLRLQNSTIQGYRKIIRNHITPQLGDIRLDKLTATRALHDHHDDDHLQPRHPDDAEGGSKPLRGASGRRLAHIPAHEPEMASGLRDESPGQRPFRYRARGGS